MKKILLLSLLFIGFLVKAQNFKKVSNSAITRHMEDAKTELDKVMEDPKAQVKPDGWFWKAKIYAYFYADSALKLKYPNSEVVADQAFDKYFSLDSSLSILKNNKAQDLFFQLYSTSFNQGIAESNSKKWDSAFYYFALAAKYTDLIFQNKFSADQKASFDTVSIFYAGIAAQNSQKPTEAVKYYDRLINCKIGGPNYLDIYKYTILNSTNTKDEKTFKKYLDLAKEAYPKEDWEDYEFNYLSKNYTLAQKADLYDKEDAAGTMSERKYLLYGETFLKLTKEEKSQIDSNKQDFYLHKSIDAFKKASLKNPSDGIAAFNAGIGYYNIFIISDDKSTQLRRSLQELNTSRVIEKDPKKKAVSDQKFKEQTESLKKQRADLEKVIAESSDSSIEWLEKVYAVLKDKSGLDRDEKSCLNKSVDYLSNIYLYKRDKSKGKDPKAFDLYDAKFKKYDELHGKF